ncbi:MAG: flagellar hook-length control protein FliK [Magnetococcales bacterium]|nr:flagellar hook-length control protein FliK [Magnetococcales bacterium]
MVPFEMPGVGGTAQAPPPSNEQKIPDKEESSAVQKGKSPFELMMERMAGVKAEEGQEGCGCCCHEQMDDQQMDPALTAQMEGANAQSEEMQQQSHMEQQGRNHRHDRMQTRRQDREIDAEELAMVTGNGVNALYNFEMNVEASWRVMVGGGGGGGAMAGAEMAAMFGEEEAMISNGSTRPLFEQMMAWRGGVNGPTAPTAGGDPATFQELMGMLAAKGGPAKAEGGTIPLPPGMQPVADTASNQQQPQNVTASATSGMEQANRMAEAKPTLNVRSPMFAHDLADQIHKLRMVHRSGHAEQVRITLEPRDLGELNLQLHVDKESQVHISITTENEMARDALNRQLSQLKEALAMHDLTFGEVHVEVGERERHASESNEGRQNAAGRDADGVDAEEGVADATAPPGIVDDDAMLNVMA